jgi:hypothetical protein
MLLSPQDRERLRSEDEADSRRRLFVRHHRLASASALEQIFQLFRRATSDLGCCPYLIKMPGIGQSKIRTIAGNLSTELEAVGIDVTMEHFSICSYGAPGESGDYLCLTSNMPMVSHNPPMDTRRIFEPLGMTGEQLAKLTKLYVDARVANFMSEANKIKAAAGEMHLSSFKIVCSRTDTCLVMRALNRALSLAEFGMDVTFLYDEPCQLLFNAVMPSE